MEQCKACGQSLILEARLFMEFKSRKKMTITDIEDFLYPLPDGDDVSMKLLRARRANTLKAVSRMQRKIGGATVLRKSVNSEYHYKL